jgi:hypothetical protein
MACGQTNPESSPAQLQTVLIQTSPDQTDSRLSAQGLAWNIVTVAASGYQRGKVSVVLNANYGPSVHPRRSP